MTLLKADHWLHVPQLRSAGATQLQTAAARVAAHQPAPDQLYEVQQEVAQTSQDHAEGCICWAVLLQELQQELAQVRQGAATSAARQEDAQAELQAQVDSLQSQLQHAEALAE